MKYTYKKYLYAVIFIATKIKLKKTITLLEIILSIYFNEFIPYVSWIFSYFHRKEEHKQDIFSRPLQNNISSNFDFLLLLLPAEIHHHPPP